MRAGWILTGVGAVMLIMAALDRRKTGEWTARQRTWLMIGGVFVSIGLLNALG